MIFDRLFNVIRSNVHDILDTKIDSSEQEKLDKEWEEYLRTSKQQKENKQREDTNTYSTPKFSAAEKDYYKLLEVKEGASFEEIKIAYKKMIKEYHPDKFHNDKVKYDSALKIAQKLNEAYAYFEKKFDK
ncbi:MAG: hypothetical protein EAZ97_12350 [Bacteroidetes bacterium]|nr:MAG: hypothetical protein EAZ97_12350 [Bacteroidota bacterium]